MNKRAESLNTTVGKNQSLARLAEMFLLREVGLITIGLLLYIILNTLFSHQHDSGLMTGFVLLFAIIKVAYFLIFTLNRIEKHLKENETSFRRCMVSFGTITVLLILSFALDYLCLRDCDEFSFSGLGPEIPLFRQFFEFNYFSLVTFATIGFGDIVPLSLGAKLLVMLEITTSFFMVVFILSNLSGVHFHYRTRIDENQL